MAYDQKKIYEQAKEAITKNNLFSIKDIIAFIPCETDSFYRFFPTDSEEYDTLKSMLEQNKVKTKSAIRSKLFKSNKASELLALYRLIATPEEHQKLNQSYIDVTTKGNKVESTFVVSSQEIADETQDFINELKTKKD